MNKNILILALSTFLYDRVKGENQLNTSEMENGESYHYQLEPIPRMLISNLKKQNEKLDAVVMMCTDKTQKTVNVNVDGHRIITASPLSYFEEKVREYDCSQRDLAESDIDFKVVPLSELEPANAVNEVVNIIRKIRDELNSEEENVVIHVDTHGGFRSIQTITEAILYLLGNEKKCIISSANIWELQYTNGKSHIENDRAIGIFNLVAGIKEFMNSGRVETLSDVIGKDNTLFKCLNKISIGIRICSLIIFERGLDELYDFYYSSGEISDVYLKIFYEEIRSEYQELLKPDRTAFDELKWCLEKGYYQQCLTFIEAAMPGYYRKKNVTHFSEDAFQLIAAHKGSHFEENNYVYNVINNVDAHQGRLEYQYNSDPGNRTNKDIRISFAGSKAIELHNRHNDLKAIRNQADHLDSVSTEIEDIDVVSMIETYVEFVKKNIEEVDIAEPWISVEVLHSSYVPIMIQGIRDNNSSVESEAGKYILSGVELQIADELKALQNATDMREYADLFMNDQVVHVKKLVKFWLYNSNSIDDEEYDSVITSSITREQIEKIYKRRGGSAEGFRKLINWLSTHAGLINKYIESAC